MNQPEAHPPVDCVRLGSVEEPINYRASSAWLVSLLLHLAFLLVVSLLAPTPKDTEGVLLLASPPVEELAIEEVPPQEFHFDPTPRELVGGSQLGGLTDELPGQLQVPKAPQIPTLEVIPLDVGKLRYQDLIQPATGVTEDLQQSIRGTAGVGIARAEGAVDRITHEILLSLEERNTLVVWFFDQSGSLSTQRESIQQRFGKVYQELGVIEAAGDPAFAASREKPLLTAIVAFGLNVQFLTKSPTDQLPEIQEAVASIATDDSGIERVFTAIRMAASRFRRYRVRDIARQADARNVMFVVFTDEAGDDQDQLDSTVQLCRRLAIPVYVIGVPAPFGRRETLVKWVDPDPRYDQSPQWGRVDQGPESLLPERIKIHFAGSGMRDEPIDSGFGPFALTRLCYETGGIYFAVHPNRTTQRAVSRRDTAAYTAHLRTFFDQDAMRRYRPEYISAQEYHRRLQSNRARQSLVQAAQSSWVTALARPRLRFVVRDEATWIRELTEAQKAAAKLEPVIRPLYKTLQQGEADRKKESVARWQAGYDLAMGRVLAVKVRAEGYNNMLAAAKRGMEFADANNNTWRLVPSTEILTGSQLKSHATKAHSYLERVVREHPGTPWAWLAKQELRQPLGWVWKESRTPLHPPPNQVAAAANNPRPPKTTNHERSVARLREGRLPNSEAFQLVSA